MKKFITLSLAITTISPAFAGKINVTEEVLEEITNANALSEARVYLSDKLKIERSTALKKVSEVDSSISRVVKQNILKEEIGKGVRGKILAIEGEVNNVYGKNIEELVSKFKTVYVSFDQSCQSKDCAFRFQLPSEISYNSSYDYTYNYFFNRIMHNYSLAAIPEVADMTTYSLKVGRLFKDKKLFKKHTTFRIDKHDRGVELLIDLEELRQITIEKKKYKGF